MNGTMEPPGQSAVPPLVVLLVESHSGTRREVGGYLREQGHTVLEAPSALEATLVSAWYQGPMNLLLVDSDLDGASGTDLAILLQSIEPGLKVLLISAAPSIDETLTVKDKKFPCLRKPFTSKQLRQRIADVLGWHGPGSSPLSSQEVSD